MWQQLSRVQHLLKAVGSKLTLGQFQIRLAKRPLHHHTAHLLTQSVIDSTIESTCSSALSSSLSRPSPSGILRTFCCNGGKLLPFRSLKSSAKQSCNSSRTLCCLSLLPRVACCRLAAICTRAVRLVLSICHLYNQLQHSQCALHTATISS